MIDVQTARQLVLQYLVKMESSMSEVNLARPEHEKKANLHLVIVKTTEYEFGWLFFYHAKELLEQEKPASILVGNAPLIVDKNDGQLYVTGTGRPIEHYIEQYRKGIRKRA